MSTTPTNPIDRLLQLGLDEGELLALIEGQSLPSDRVAMIARDPELSKLVSALRADHAALGALASMRAPDGLLDSVEARLEREALMGLAQAGEASKDIPVSTIVYDNDPVIGRIFANRWTSRLAIAASVMLALGLGWSLIAPVVRSTQRPPIAINTPPAPTDVAGTSAEIKAKAESKSATTVADSANAGPSVTAAPAPSEPAVAKADTSTEPEPVAMTPERAIELARAGRLGVKVRCVSPEMARKNLVAQLPGGAALDTLANDRASIVIAQTQQIIHERAVARAKPRGAPANPGAPTLAGTGNASNPLPTPRSGEPIGAPNTQGTLDGSAWRVSIAPEENRLRTLIRRVTGKNADFSAELIELPASVDLPLPLDIDQVLWWSRPAAQWDQRLSIPVVIERP